MCVLLDISQCKIFETDKIFMVLSFVYIIMFKLTFTTCFCQLFKLMINARKEQLGLGDNFWGKNEFTNFTSCHSSL